MHHGVLGVHRTRGVGREVGAEPRDEPTIAVGEWSTQCLPGLKRRLRVTQIIQACGRMGETEDDERVPIAILPVIDDGAIRGERTVPAAMLAVAHVLDEIPGAALDGIDVRLLAGECIADGEVVEQPTLGDECRLPVGVAPPLPVESGQKQPALGRRGREPMGQDIAQQVCLKPREVDGRHGGSPVGSE